MAQVVGETDSAGFYARAHSLERNAADNLTLTRCRSRWRYSRIDKAEAARCLSVYVARVGWQQCDGFPAAIGAGSSC